MLEVRATYPLIRGKRPIHQRRRRVRRWARARLSLELARRLGYGLLAVLVVAGVVVLARQAARPDPEVALRDSIAALARGNYSAARNHATDASEARPGWAEAQLALARAQLALGNGPAAEGAIQRAVTAGFPAPRARALFAHAYWLEGDTDQALDAARKVPAEDQAYATRIRARALADQGDVEAAQALLVSVLVRTPRDAAAWGALGRIRLRAGDFSGASEAAGRAVALDATNLDAVTLAGELVRRRYGLVAALPWFEKALAKDAYFHPALVEYAATLGDLGRYTEMLGAARRALAARPGSPQALYLEAVLAARAGRFDLARTLLAKTEGQVEDMPGALLLAGALDYAEGKPQQAIGSWGELVARQPMNLAARRLLGTAQLRSGDPRAALATVRPIALRADADAYTLSLVARAFAASGEPTWSARFRDRAANPVGGGAAPFGNDTSLPVLAVAVAEAPGDPSAAVEYVRGLIEAGRGEDALARARTMAAATPGAPAAQMLVGDTLMALGRADAAIPAYRAAADLDFGAPAMLRLVEATAAARQPKAAAAVLALYLAQNPESIVARRLAANLQRDSRDWDAAIDTLEGLRSAIGPRDWLLLSDLAYAYANAGDAVTALRYARAAYALAPMTARVCDAYGWALYQAGNVPQALQLAIKATQIAPADSVARWHLAQLLAEAGRKVEAKIAIARVLADPAFADRAAAAALAKAL